MVNNLEKNMNSHVKDNIWFYLSTITCIFVGMLIGIYYVKYMSPTDKNNMGKYLVNFIKDYNSIDINYKQIFFQAIKNNILIILLLWFLGLTVIGIPIILIVDGIKGFTLGFSISTLVNGLGTKGIWMSILALIPQNVIYIPCVVFISVISMKFSLNIIRNRINKQWTTNIMQKILGYSIFFLVITLIMFIGFFIESYFVPNVIKLVV